MKTIDEVLEQYANYLHDAWSGNKPLTPTINRREAKAELEKLMAAERLDELKFLTDTSYAKNWIDHDDYSDGIKKRSMQLEQRISELEAKARGESDDRRNAG